MISLQIGSLDRLSPEDQQRQIVELFNRLENYLNDQLVIHVRRNVKDPFPKFAVGDLLFDFTVEEGYVTIFQWDGKKLVPIIPGATGATGPEGPKGDKGDPGDSGVGGELVSSGQLPNPEIVFDDVTGDVVYAL
jgi:hypothetical protein